MDEIVSLVVANGIFAVLFCGLLVFELRDSRSREDKYESIIRALNERLRTVEDIKADTEKIVTDVGETKSDVKHLRLTAERKTHGAVKPAKTSGGGEECAALATT